MSWRATQTKELGLKRVAAGDAEKLGLKRDPSLGGAGGYERGQGIGAIGSNGSEESGRFTQ